MKTFKTAAALAASCSLLFAGCAASSEPVTEDNAPTDLLKQAAAITGESSADEVVDVFSKIIDATYDTTEGHMVLNESINGQGIDPDSDVLKTIETKMSSYDVRYGEGSHFYQLYEQEGAESPIYGLMDSSLQGIDTVYTELDGSTLGNPEGKMKIAAITSQEEELESAGEDEDAEGFIKNSVTYPFYTMMGANLVLQPTYAPQYYNFDLTKTGSDYVWTISTKDAEEYNKALDETFTQYYGHGRTDIKGDGSLIVDVYNIDSISLILTMDENGCLKKTETTTASTVVQGDVNLNLSTKSTVSVKAADEGWKTFFPAFFQNVKDGKLKEGDTFTLQQTFENSASDQSAKTSESAVKDSSDKNSSQQKEDSEKSSSEKKSESEKESSASQKDSSDKSSQSELASSQSSEK